VSASKLTQLLKFGGRMSLGKVLSVAVAALTICGAVHANESSTDADSMRFVQVAAQSKEQRSAIESLGMSIEALRSDSVWGFATLGEIESLRQHGFNVMGVFSYETGRGGHEGIFDFPPNDARFHNYAETNQALQALQAKNSDITSIISIGKSVEG